jgi:glycosyltransferase involved in cell wall biosynthesis
MDEFKILLGSPVHQKPKILREFLASLKRLTQETYRLDYFFIDDNTCKESKEMLLDFAKEVEPACTIGMLTEPMPQPYVCDEKTHYWKESIITKVAAFKDAIINVARSRQYDYLFLIDSDLVLHPRAIEQLIATNKDIVSNIFWTKWELNCRALPQVWLKDSYIMYEVECGENLSQDEMSKRHHAFIEMLKKPGTYEVGGLGACTLISKAALNQGVSFAKIKNLTLWGEDRHFCIRAVAKGLSLFVDTHYPAYHIYRETDLPGVENYKRGSPRLTLSMVIRNESGNDLRRMLEDARQYITDAVIIDDASTDNSVQICEETLKGIPLRLIKNQESKFSNEILLRKQQWEETIQTNPEWILTLDADEIFEEKFKKEVAGLISDPQADAYFFRLYDFWDENSYRSDSYWCAHQNYRPFLVRYRPSLEVKWQETPQHCGRIPNFDMQYPVGSPLRIKHYGWSQPSRRLAKYQRYRMLDPDAKYGWKEQYESILDERPNLVDWVENEVI